MEDTKQRIFEASIDVFNEKGWKFTMDDIAKKLSISKKTIYKLFDDKETLFYETVDYCFNEIKKSEREIYEDDSLSIEEKFKKILIVLPNRYANIDFRKISGAEEKYPEVCKEIQRRIENDWDITIAILEEGIKQGVFRKISIPVLKIMVEASIQKFFGSNELADNNISYDEALKKLLDIVLMGIMK